VYVIVRRHKEKELIVKTRACKSFLFLPAQSTYQCSLPLIPSSATPCRLYQPSIRFSLYHVASVAIASLPNNALPLPRAHLYQKILVFCPLVRIPIKRCLQNSHLRYSAPSVQNSFLSSLSKHGVTFMTYSSTNACSLAQRQERSEGSQV
jgi:hypothetical protein